MESAINPMGESHVGRKTAVTSLVQHDARRLDAAVAYKAVRAAEIPVCGRRSRYRRPASAPLISSQTSHGPNTAAAALPNDVLRPPAAWIPIASRIKPQIVKRSSELAK